MKRRTVLMFALCSASISCGDPDSLPNRTIQLVELDGPDTESSLGFSLSEVLKQGPWVSSLTWSTTQSDLSAVAVEDATEVAIALEDPSGAIVEEIVHCESKAEFAGTDRCRSSVRSSVLLTVQTKDGALSEEMEADLQAFAPDDLVWIGAQRASMLHGTAVFDSEETAADDFELMFHEERRPDDVAGALLGRPATDVDERGSDDDDVKGTRSAMEILGEGAAPTVLARWN